MTPDEKHTALVGVVSNILWRLDPMGTSCNVNEGMEDEYDVEASKLVQRMREGAELRQAVVEVFEKAFWVACFETPKKRPALKRLLVDLTPIFRMSPLLQPRVPELRKGCS
jgi:hypothetical protein